MVEAHFYTKQTVVKKWFHTDDSGSLKKGMLFLKAITQHSG
jgi:hypothetical protein